METKTCCRCNETKLLSDYYMSKNKREGVCKACRAQRRLEQCAAMTPEEKEAQLQRKREVRRAYRKNNPEKFKQYSKNQSQSRSLNPIIKSRRNKYRATNMDVERKRSRAYYRKNKDSVLAYQRGWGKKRVDKLSLGYVNILLGGNQHKKFPVEILEAKRVQIQIRRAIRNMTPANQAPQGAST